MIHDLEKAYTTWVQSLETGSEVFVAKRLGTDLRTGVVTKICESGSFAVETEEGPFHFSPRGFDKRTVRGTTYWLHPVTPARVEQHRREWLLKSLDSVNLRGLETDQLEVLWAVISNEESND